MGAGSQGSPIFTENSNYVEYTHFSGRELDFCVTLNKPAKRFFVLCILGPAAAMVTVAYFSFAPLKFGKEFTLATLPFNKDAFPLTHFERAVSTGLGTWGANVGLAVPPLPMLKFRCPFTKFYINFWGIDVNGNVTDSAFTLVSSNDIEDLRVYPIPKVIA